MSARRVCILVTPRRGLRLQSLDDAGPLLVSGDAIANQVLRQEPDPATNARAVPIYATTVGNSSRNIETAPLTLVPLVLHLQ